MSDQNDDVIDVLLRQHRAVENLLDLMDEGTTTSQETFDALVRILVAHESGEEQVVHPAVRGLPGGSEVVDARLGEEHEAKLVLADLQELGVFRPGFEPKFQAFAAAIRQHAQHEEQYEFPALRAGKPAEELRAMVAALEAAQAIGPTRPHPHTGESVVANVLGGPLLGALDRIRDAVRDFTRAHSH